MPLPETVVMFITVAIVVATHNLAIGVAAGVVLAMVLFARRVAHVVSVERTLADDGLSVRYAVPGPLFFGSSNDLVEQFSYGDDPARCVDFTDAQIWDASSVAVLDSVETKYRQHGAASLHRPRRAQPAFHGRLTGQLQA